MTLIVGINITTPIVADDEMNTTSTADTPFLIINKISTKLIDNLSNNSYKTSFTYSIYNGVDDRNTLKPINYTYTGITNSFEYTIETDIDTLIEDCYVVITDYFDNNGISYTLMI